MFAVGIGLNCSRNEEKWPTITTNGVDDVVAMVMFVGSLWRPFSFGN